MGWVLAAGLAAFALLTSTTLSAWTQATLRNTTDTAAAGKLAFTHAYTGGPCVGAAGVASVACPPTLGTAASPPASTADAITNNSTVATTQSVKGLSCGPVQLANSVTATDPMLVRNSVAFQQTDKWATTSAATFSGSGYAADVVGTTGSGLLGLLQANFSIGLWFKAGDAQGGGLLSLDNSVSSAASAAGLPSLWLDTAGKVHFAVSSTLGITQRTSTTAYASGWHFAVLTVSQPVLVATINLYVDGTSRPARPA